MMMFGEMFGRQALEVYTVPRLAEGAVAFAGVPD